ncbi:hypothetical protein LZZ85_25845 [Terrimonas sp. NA20]|uniref:PKD domain-containing protein n=1 Tax=Terrimonas ginsenosidimutans TaxID=2908004 RepID=A0ABS9KZH5_9BACT|nr:hypothetical protein [Terrimonas ginsenosidimutans]MCG2617751.1 hypothetical protein [Terrimonas ginsenosidimutans]
MKPLLILSMLSLGFFACRKEVSTNVTTDFSYEVVDDSYTTPVQVKFVNKTSGALFYKWTFPGGSPAVYDKKDPGIVTFDTTGEITIKLEAWNDEQRVEKEIKIVIDSPVEAGFNITAQQNAFGPSDFVITSTTSGATEYNWLFENGSPSSATGSSPAPVHYDQPGTYRIFLEAKNARGVKDTLSKWITVYPALSAAFDIEPSFDDDDYEAPLVATLHNKTTSATSHKWTVNGGVVAGSSDSISSIRFDHPGTYTVVYESSNGKQSETVTRTITVKPNSGLRTVADVKLGINTAHASVGSFYSTSLRKVFKKEEVNNSNGNKIDIVFFGLNDGFSFNQFINPASAATWTFDAIPGATVTSVINKQEETSVQLSAAAFDQLNNGSALNAISVPPNNADASFNATLPRIVLFKNAEGKKGAIKVKQFVQAGLYSYIICDIKFQKE